MMENDVVCVLKNYAPAFYTISPDRMKQLLDVEKKLEVSEHLRDSQFERLWSLVQAIEIARDGADEDFDFFLNHLSNIINNGDNNESN